MAGVGVGDVIALVQVVISTYETCANAPDTLREVGKDLNFLHRSMVSLQDILKDLDRYIGPEGRNMAGYLEQEVKQVKRNLKGIKKLLNKWRNIPRMPYLKSKLQKALFIWISRPEVENRHQKLKSSSGRISDAVAQLQFFMTKRLAGKMADKEALKEMLEELFKATLDSRAKEAKEDRKREQECTRVRKFRKEQAPTVEKVATSKMGAWNELQEDLVEKGMSSADAKKFVEDIRAKLSEVESARADPPRTLSSNRRESPRVASSSGPPTSAPSSIHHTQTTPRKRPEKLAPPELRVTRAQSDASDGKAEGNTVPAQRRSRSASPRKVSKLDALSATGTEEESTTPSNNRRKSLSSISSLPVASSTHHAQAAPDKRPEKLALPNKHVTRAESDVSNGKARDNTVPVQRRPQSASSSKVSKLDVSPATGTEEESAAPSNNRRKSLSSVSSSTRHAHAAPRKQPEKLAPPEIRVTRAASNASNDKARDNAAPVKRRSRSASPSRVSKLNASSATGSDEDSAASSRNRRKSLSAVSLADPPIPAASSTHHTQAAPRKKPEKRVTRAESNASNGKARDDAVPVKRRSRSASPSRASKLDASSATGADEKSAASSSNRRKSLSAVSLADLPTPAASSTHHTQASPRKRPEKLAPPDLRVTRAESDASNGEAGDNAVPVKPVKRRSRSASPSKVSEFDASSATGSNEDSAALAPPNTGIRRAKSDASARKSEEKTLPARKWSRSPPKERSPNTGLRSAKSDAPARRSEEKTLPARKRSRSPPKEKRHKQKPLNQSANLRALNLDLDSQEG